MLAKIDVFPKFIDRNIHMKTVYGGLITIVTSLWVSFLVFGRIYANLFPTLSSTVVLDSEPLEGQRKVFINFDITIKTPCTMLHLDLFEHDGSEKLDIIDNITRTRIDGRGMKIEQAMKLNLKKPKPANFSIPKDYCGSCYGALPKTECCNSCEDVMRAFEKKGWSFFSADRWDQCVREGIIDFGEEVCHINGSLKVKRDSGRFHFGLGRNNLDSSRGHAHDLSSVLPSHSLNHSIKTFDFGRRIFDFDPPLREIEVQLPINNNSLWLVTYYLHVVPSKYVSPTLSFESYRYSSMYSQRPLANNSRKGYPGISFYYDFSPMKVITTPNRSSFHDLIVYITGTIGGAFSFAAIFDAIMFGALSTIEGKRIIGKDI